jgi:hypothetical protein
MSEKQDRTYTRTASELERKYQFGKTFAEMLGLINDTRDHVDSVNSVLRSDILEQVTSITRDSEKILMSALESYVETDGIEELEATLKSEFEVMAENIAMSFYEDTIKTELSDVDGELNTVVENLQKHFDFGVDGLTIRAGENTMQLKIDNDMILFTKNGKQFGWWDGVDFHTGNIVVDVNERAQFGSFAFVPRSNGSLSFLKVGD